MFALEETKIYIDKYGKSRKGGKTRPVYLFAGYSQRLFQRIPVTHTKKEISSKLLRFESVIFSMDGKLKDSIYQIGCPFIAILKGRMYG
jgi:hypothetical protein